MLRIAEINQAKFPSYQRPHKRTCHLDVGFFCADRKSRSRFTNAFTDGLLTSRLLQNWLISSTNQTDSSGLAHTKKGNWVQAHDCFQLAAQKQHLLGTFELAKCFAKGLGCTKDPRKAFELMHLCSEYFPKACWCLGLTTLSSSNQLGDYYKEGLGTEVDKEAAKACFARVQKWEKQDKVVLLNTFILSVIKLFYLFIF